MKLNITNNQKIQINKLIDNLDNVCKSLELCRLTKHKRFNSIPEYILFTVLSYFRLESVCNELETIMKQIKPHVSEVQ